MPVRPSRNLALKKLRDCFPDAHSAADALAILDIYGSQPWHGERERVQLAILKGCSGDLSRLLQLAELADADYRDALAGAEYPEECQVSSTTSSQKMAAIRKRDRAQYDAWLESGE